MGCTWIPFFLCGPLGLFHYAGTTWALSGNVFCCVFGTTWTHPYFVSLHVLIFSVIFLVWSVLSFYFLYFLLQMLKKLLVGRLAFYFVRSFGSLLLILELITQLLIIVDRFVSLRRGACIALGRFLFSQLLQSQFPCICIIYLKIH